MAGRDGPDPVRAPPWRCSLLIPKLAIAAAITVATLAAYWPVQYNDFLQFDDHVYITQNKVVQAGMTAEGAAWALTTFEVSNWHPLTWLSHMQDYELYKLDPAGHHWSSLVFHTLNAVLLFWMLADLTGGLWRSAFVAGLFALHPLHVESVAWISERKDVLSTMFWILTLWSWGRYARGGGSRPYGVAVVLFALGLSAKPMLVTLPFVLLLLDVWPLGRTALWSAHEPRLLPKRPLSLLLLEKLPLFALTAASCLVTVLAQSEAGAVKSFKRFPLANRSLNSLTAYFDYLAHTVWPFELAAFYPFPVLFALPHLIAAAALLGGASWFAWTLRRSHPYLAVGWLWYLGTLVPVIGLLQVGEQAMADRYTYVPLIGVFIAVAWAVPDFMRVFPGRRAVLAGLAVVVLAVCGVQTREQVKTWKDTVTVFSHALEITRNNWLAQFFLGNAYRKQGRLDLAVEHLHAAVAFRPIDPTTRLEYAQALHANEQLDEALVQYVWILDKNRYHARALNGAGSIALEREEYPAAVDFFSRALQSAPDHESAYLNLKVALRRQREAFPDETFIPAALRLLSPADQLEYYMGRELEDEDNGD